MTPCISQVCTLTSTFADELAAWSDAGWTTVEIWLTKLEDLLKSTSADEIRKQLSDHGVEITSAAYQGGLLTSEGGMRKANFEHFKQRLGLCEMFGIRTLLIAADYCPPAATIDFVRIGESLAEAAKWAAGFGVRLGLEFRSREAICTSLDTAVQLAAFAANRTSACA